MSDSPYGLAAQTSYDRVPYPNLSYSQSHPDRLATLALLRGMRPAPVEQCRVLELGCAGGGNLIPMAYGLPESYFVGVDLSARQIARGQATAEALGLRNIALHQQDILTVTSELGEFDYIIAHGVFSWVPRAVQDKILEICKENLAPDGVAYVSYNTYPGWHLFNIVRDLMRYHTREIDDPEHQAREARAILTFFAESCPPENSAYGSFLRMYAEFVQGGLEGSHPRTDALLLHDELEQVNEPVYFHQFAERVAQVGLHFLAEANFADMIRSNIAPEVSDALGEMAHSLVDWEQYMDFLQNRTFRQTLLCHQGVTLNRKLQPDAVAGLWVASRARSDSQGCSACSADVEKFCGHDGAVLSTDHPVSKAAMRYLPEIWPRAVSFGELVSVARARLALEAGMDTAYGPPPRDGAPPTNGAPLPSGDVDAQVLGSNLLTAYGYSDSLAELHAYSPRLVLQAGERPTASAVARYQAQSDSRVTNMRHERVYLDESDRYLLSHLDGSHDRTALVSLLVAGPTADSMLTPRRDEATEADAEGTERALTEALEARLCSLARAALLVA